MGDLHLKTYEYELCDVCHAKATLNHDGSRAFLVAPYFVFRSFDEFDDHSEALTYLFDLHDATHRCEQLVDDDG